ncbi:MAG: hypothetical protein PVI21_06405 [Candidatus Woesebacteria bacterium]
MSRIEHNAHYSLCEQRFNYILDDVISDRTAVVGLLDKIEGVLQVEVAEDGRSVAIITKNSLTDEEVARIRFEVIFVLSGKGCISVDPHYVQ